MVGGDYGASGSGAFIGSALLFTAAVLFYSLKGGLRSSIFSDAIQAVVLILFLGLVLAWVLPGNSPRASFSQGSFALDSGADLLITSGRWKKLRPWQSRSYRRNGPEGPLFIEWAVTRPASRDPDVLACL